MSPLEPLLHSSTTPAFLAAAALFLAASILLSRATARVGLPLFLIFILLGVAAGRVIDHPVAPDSYRVAANVGLVVLILILVDGGLNTPLELVQPALAPALLLATAGIAGTMALLALAARCFGLSWAQAFLIGAIVAPTDAAATFTILRSSGLQPRKRLALVLELESGLNDPLAVMLTIVLTAATGPHHAPLLAGLAYLLLQLLVGTLTGVLAGYGGSWILVRAALPAGGLYPVLTLALALFAYGLAETLGGNGFLAVYLAAVLLGRNALPYRSGILRFHDSAAWLGQIVMYAVLGMLAQPTALWRAAPTGLALGLLLAVLARPLAVAMLLAPLRFRWREVAYLGWVGMRGAVPIILAIYPVLARVPGADAIFHIVFFIVLVSTLIPGATVRRATRLLGIASKDPPPPPVLEIVSTRPMRGGEILSFALGPSAAAAGAAISDLPLPADSAVLLIIRDGRLLAPHTVAALTPGDHIYVLCDHADRPLIHLIFGAPETQ